MLDVKYVYYHYIFVEDKVDGSIMVLSFTNIIIILFLLEMNCKTNSEGVIKISVYINDDMECYNAKTMHFTS